MQLTLEQQRELEVPGFTYIGRDGKERFLVKRGNVNQRNVFEEKAGGSEFCWEKATSDKLFYCWCSTWRGWVKERKT